jgi:putative ABC transport system permease protein
MANVRYAFRWLLNRPGFAAVAIVTLALGIGANAAIFSVIDAVLLRPLPYPDADRLMMPWEYSAEIQQRLGFDRLPSSPADFHDFQRLNSTFQGLASMRGERVNLTGGGEPQRVGAVRVSSNFFHVLGVDAILGRTFTPDDAAAAGRTILISERLWRQRLASDPDVTRKTVMLNGESATIVGVLPEWFRFPSAGELPEGFGFAPDPAIWTLDVFNPKQQINRGGKSYALVGRLAPGVTQAAAEADLARIADGIARESPLTNAGWTVHVLSLREQLVGGVRPALMVLLTAVGFVLLIACANVANLLLVRAASRQRDLSVRYALGAGRPRLVMGLVGECVLLSTIAGMLGVVVGWWTLRALLALVPTTMPALSSATFDYRVLGFAVALSILTGVVFGAAPALHATRGELVDGLREGGRGAIGNRRASRVRNALVVCEVALAVVLLIGTALLIQTFVRLTSVRTGFRTDRVLTMEVALPPLLYQGGSAATFFQTLIERLTSVPGVEAVGITSGLPLAGSENLLPVTIEGRPKPAPGQELISDYRAATPGYFAALSIPLLDGELMPDQMSSGRPGVVVVNETMARTGWPGERAIGKRIKLAGFEPDTPWHTVIGVVGDTKHSALESLPRAQVYVPHRQYPSEQMTVAMRTSGDPLAAAVPARVAVLGIDPNQPVGRIQTMSDVVARSVSGRRFQLLIVGVFAGLALVLSLVGLYAVVSYSVAQRTNEMAVRLALGARPAALVRLVLFEGLKLAGAGILLGLLAARVVTGLLQTVLFGVNAGDPPTFALVSVVLFVAALAGCLAPACRAMRVDPAASLRSE